MNRDADGVLTKVLTLRTGDMKVCLNINSVIKIILLPSLERLPINKPYVVGMMNYAGQSIPVMDLYTLLTGARENPYTLDNPVIIVKNNELISGIVVDEVYGIKTILPESIQHPEEFNYQQSLIHATVIFNDELYLLLKDNFLNQINISIDKDIIKKINTHS